MHEAMPLMVGASQGGNRGGPGGSGSRDRPAAASRRSTASAASGLFPGAWVCSCPPASAPAASSNAGHRQQRSERQSHVPLYPATGASTVAPSLVHHMRDLTALGIRRPAARTITKTPLARPRARPGTLPVRRTASVSRAACMSKMRRGPARAGSQLGQSCGENGARLSAARSVAAGILYAEQNA